MILAAAFFFLAGLVFVHQIGTWSTFTTSVGVAVCGVAGGLCLSAVWPGV